MRDMSRWNADQPGTTAIWWTQQASAIPRVAQVEFNEFVAALSTYNLANTPANLSAVSESVSALIDAIPNSIARIKGRERIAIALPEGKLRNLMHSSTANSGRCESENLLLGLRNLVTALGGNIVPKAYQV